MTSTSAEITQLLVQWHEGDKTAFDELFLLVHAELRRLASLYIRHERPGHILQVTALINEAYLRLVKPTSIPFQNRRQFYAVAAKVMRHILADHARSLACIKRGAGAEMVSLDETCVVAQRTPADLPALHDARTDLERLDPRKSLIVELRFFVGLSMEEIAEILGVAEVTIGRDWNTAKAWLLREISERDDDEDDERALE
jgi:RNA polymerase sigma factor (TIGR02999 family)